MKKKLFTFFTSAFLLIPTMLGLTGCGGKGEITYDDYEEIKTIASTIINSYDTLKVSEDVSTSKPAKNTFASSTEFSPNDLFDMLNDSSSKVVCQTSKTWFEGMTQSMFAMALAGGKLMADEYEDPDYFGTVLKAWEGSDPTPENPDANIAYEYFQLKEVDEYNKTLLVYGPQDNFYLKMTMYFKDKNNFEVEYVSCNLTADEENYEQIDYWYANSDKQLLQVMFYNWGDLAGETYEATWHNGIDTFQIEPGVLNNPAEDCIEYILERKNPKANIPEVRAMGTTEKYSFHYDKMWEAFDFFMGDLINDTENLDAGTPFTNRIVDGCLMGINYEYVTEEVITLPTGIDSIMWGMAIPNTIKKIIIPNNVKYIKIRQQDYDTALASYNAQNGFTSNTSPDLKNSFVDSTDGGAETYVKLPAELAEYTSSPLFVLVDQDGSWLNSGMQEFTNIEFSTSSAQTLFSYTPDGGGVCVTLEDFNMQPQTLCFALKDVEKVFEDVLRDVVFNGTTQSLIDYAKEKISIDGITMLPQATRSVEQDAEQGTLDLVKFVKTLTINAETNNYIDLGMFRKTNSNGDTIPNLYTLQKITLNCPTADESEYSSVGISLGYTSIKSIDVIEVNTVTKQIAIQGDIDYQMEVGAIYFEAPEAYHLSLQYITLKASNIDMPAKIRELSLTGFVGANNLTMNFSKAVSLIDLDNHHLDDQYNHYSYEFMAYYDKELGYDRDTTSFTLKHLPTVNGTFAISLAESFDAITDKNELWEASNNYESYAQDTEEKMQKSAWITYNIMKFYPERINFYGPLSAVIFDSKKVADKEYKITLTNSKETIDVKDYFYNNYSSTYKLSTTNNFENPLSSTNISLEYGNNIVYMQLTSEDGQQTCVYKLNFYRSAKYTASFVDRNGLLDDIEDVYYDENKLVFTLPTGYMANVSDESLFVVTQPAQGAITPPNKAGKYKLTFEFDSDGNSSFYYYDGSEDTSSLDGAMTFYKLNTTSGQYELEVDPYDKAGHFRVECYIDKSMDFSSSFKFYDENYDQTGEAISVSNILYYEYEPRLTPIKDAFPDATVNRGYNAATEEYYYTVLGISENITLSIAVEYKIYYIYATIFNQSITVEDSGKGDGEQLIYATFENIERSKCIGYYTINNDVYTLPNGGIAGYKVTGDIYLTGVERLANNGVAYYELSDKVTSNTISLAGRNSLYLYINGASQHSWNVEFVLEGMTYDDVYPVSYSGSNAYFDTINNKWNSFIIEVVYEDGYDYTLSFSSDYSNPVHSYYIEGDITTLEQYAGYNNTLVVYAKKVPTQYCLSISVPYDSVNDDIVAGFEGYVESLLADGYVADPNSTGAYIKYFTKLDSFDLPSLDNIPEGYITTGYLYSRDYITTLPLGTMEHVYLTIDSEAV